MNCVPRGEKRHSLFLCFAAVCAIAACAQAEQKFDESNGRAAASSGRGGTSTGGRTGAGGTPAGAGSTARGGGSTIAGGSGGKGGVGSVTGGSGGADDSAGSAGDGDGEGGTGGTPPIAGECAESPTARAQYKVLRSDSVVQFQLRFYNEGATALALSQYEFDYYFSNEEDSAWNTYVDDASTNGGADGYIALQGATTVTVEPLAPGAVGATHVLRVVINSAIPLEGADEGLLTIRLEPTSYEPPHQAQADDYSFDASKTDLSDWDKIAVLAVGDLAWGCVP